MEILYKKDKLLLEASENAKKYLIHPFKDVYKIITVWNNGDIYECSEHYNIRDDNDVLFIVDKNHAMNNTSFIYSFKTKKLYKLYRYNWDGVYMKIMIEHDHYFHNYKGIKIFSPYKDDSNNYTNEEISSFVDYLEDHGDFTITGERGYPNYKKEK